MTALDVFSALAGFLQNDPPIEAATVAKPATRDGIHEARHLPLEESAKAFFERITASSVIDAGEPHLRELDHTFKPDAGTVEWTRLQDVEAVRTACERYENLNPYSPFRPDDESYKKRMSFWVASRASGGERAFFFRAFSSSSELKRKRGAALVSRDGSFERVQEQIFLFDENIDCIVFRDYIFVLRKNDYRRIFDQLEQLRQHARVAAGRLHAQVPIANLEAFTAACEAQPGMADKLIAVQGRDYFPRLTYSMLMPVIDEFELEIDVESHAGVAHLVFKSGPADRWRILRLVDDDFLRSSMTDHRYEVNSKTATG